MTLRIRRSWVIKIMIGGVSEILYSDVTCLPRQMKARQGSPIKGAE